MNKQLEKDIRQDYPDRLTWQKTIPTFHPQSGDEVAGLFRLSLKYRQKLFINGFGNNIDPVGDPFKDLLVIKTDRLNSLIEIEPADFCITVGAGYPLIGINRAIAGKNLWFPFSETMYPGSVGGALACGLTAFDGSHDLPLMRALLSVTAVLPDGHIIRPGARTFKSVSGYDISRIFFNSWGILGLVTELSFRVLPLSKKKDYPHLFVRQPDRQKFIDDLNSKTPLGEMCHKIKAEYDPHNRLPAV